MTKRKDGGQAFPTEFYETEHGDRVEPFAGSPGMTLRDWFAGQALANMSGVNPNLPGDPASPQFFPETHELVRRQAIWAFLMADAMIAERDK